MSNIKTFKNEQTEFEINSFDGDKEIRFCISHDGYEKSVIFLTYNQVKELRNHLGNCFKDINEAIEPRYSDIINRFSGDNLLKLQKHFTSLYGSDEIAQEKSNSFALGFGKACELICKDLKNNL